MAKKFGKFLLCTAAIGAAAAAAYYYLQKKEADCLVQETPDEDYDDFTDESEGDASATYVTLTPETANDAETEKAAPAEAAEETVAEEAAAVCEAPAQEPAEAPETVEEFFDEEKAE